MPRPLFWLHLSDLHFGAEGQAVRDQVTYDFRRWLEGADLASSTGPDLILLSGDVAYSGKPEEYGLADAFLADLRTELRRRFPACDPVLIPVPGNHDLARPDEKQALAYDVFSRYAESTDDDRNVRILNDLLWKRQDGSQLEALFSAYQAWLKTGLAVLDGREDVKVHRSHIPGDLCVELHLDGTFPLCIVGLNSAWLQYSGDVTQGQLAVSPRQFMAVLPRPERANPLDIFTAHPRAMLMMHHPPAWFSPRAQEAFYDEVFVPDRFDLCLYGHMHAPRAKAWTENGGCSWTEFQSPSLCGLEHFGRYNEERSFGFTLGCLTSEGEVRIWPYRRKKRGGQFHFVLDDSFSIEADKGAVIRKLSGPPAIPPGLPAEGVLLRIVLLGLQRAPSQPGLIASLSKRFTELVHRIARANQLEPIDCTQDGKFTLFLTRAPGDSWSELLQQALEIAFNIPTTLAQEAGSGSRRQSLQAAVAVHAAHEAHRLPPAEGSRVFGREIDYANGMLFQPTGPCILLSVEAYAHLVDLLGDSEAAARLLPKEISSASGPGVRLEVRKLMTAPYKQDLETGASRDGWQTQQVYNLCLRSGNGRLLLGHELVLPDQIYLGPISPHDDQLFVDHLVRADRVSLVAITHENLPGLLYRALSERRRQGRGFWDEMRVVFLARQLLGAVLDCRANEIGLEEAARERHARWDGNVRGVRELLMGLGAEASHKWECLQFNYIFPFEAQRYTVDGSSVIRTRSILPQARPQDAYCIETATGNPLHAQFSNAVDAIIRTATPIVEFNVYGHMPAGSQFYLAGLVNQREWRSFRPPEGEKPCFPVSLIFLHTRVGGHVKVLLQLRTMFNTGGDFDVFSLISGKVNDEDFFFPQQSSRQYRDLAYRVASSSDDNMRQQLSNLFARERNLVIGQPVAAPVMEAVWKNTAIRELNSELGLDIPPERMYSYPCPHFLDRGDFDLYVNLYVLEIEPDERSRVEQLRPNANLEPFSLVRLMQYNDNTDKASASGADAKAPKAPTLNHFLNRNFATVVLPLVRDLGLQ